MIIRAALALAVFFYISASAAKSAPTIEALRSNQFITFMVAKGHVMKSVPSIGMIRFRIVLQGGSSASATITLELDALSPPDAVAAAWGHPWDRPVKRVLSKADVLYIDTFLQRYAEQKQITDPALEDTYAAREFTTSEITPETGNRPPPKRISYKENLKLDAEFINQFLGVAW